MNMQMVQNIQERMTQMEELLPTTVMHRLFGNGKVNRINRDYNPVTGRYIQSDPIGFDGGVNGFGYVGGNPLVLVDLEGQLMVYIWNYGGSLGPYGHAVMTLEDGTYISWWPSVATSLFNGWLDSDPLVARDIEMDTSWEDGKMFDYYKYIDFLDEGKIKSWWLKFRNREKYNGMWQNCATTVADGLIEGGANNYTSESNSIWTPTDIKSFIRSMTTGYNNQMNYYTWG